MRGSQVATTTRRSRAASKAPGINRDYSDTDYRESDVYDGPEPTKGIYRFKLVGVQEHTSADDNESIQWIFQIMDGEENKHGDSVAGWKGRKYTNGDGAKWVEQKIAVATGLIKNPKDTLDMSFADIIKRAKPCRALVAMERYIPDDGGDPEWRASLTSVFMPDDGGASSSKAKSRAAEDVDDDEEAEEEEPPPKTRARRSRAKAEPEPEPEDDEEDEEPEDEGEVDLDALEEELLGLSLVALKKRARAEGVTVKRGMSDEEIVEAIMEKAEEELGEEEDEEEEEPEPPTRGRTRSASSAARSKSDNRGKRGYSDEPPF
jgi:hypothetical protein